MNQRTAIRLDPDEQLEVLRTAKKASLSTIDAEGYPHVVAMGFVEEAGKIIMTSYAKAQKVLNIRRNPKVAIMVEEGSDYSNFRALA